MNHQNLKNQLLRYLHNELQADEITHLLEQLDQFASAEVEDMLDEKSLEAFYELKYLSQHRKEEIKANLMKRMSKMHVDELILVPKPKFKWTWAAAAVILIALTFSAYLWYLQIHPDGIGSSKLAIQNDISLNEQPVEVQFSDGRVLELDTNKQYSQKALTFSMNEDGIVHYNASEKHNHESIIFSSPKGRIAQIVLSDGTLVWLNSGSSIRFNPFFEKNQRNIELQGEAYFEVSKNPEKPFVVHSNLSTVKVLGTAFNVSSYASAPHRVTLLHGSIALTTKEKMTLLQPETQAEININGAMSISLANIEEVMGWKNGDFVFNDIDLKGLMDQLKKWYDIDAVIVEGKSTDRFTGSVSRSKQLSQLLKQLEFISDYKFSIVERRVYVKVI